MNHQSEHESSHRLIGLLRDAGYQCRKVEDRAGGLPDWLYTDGTANEWVEFKQTPLAPPWTPVQLGLRPAQHAFFRQWRGPAYLAAWQQNRGWWICRAPADSIRWAFFNTDEMAAAALRGKLAMYGDGPWLRSAYPVEAP